MAGSSDFFKKVLADVEDYRDRRRIARAGILERLIVRKVPPARLHANPDDEFTHENVGPNERIIQSYCERVRNNRWHGGDIFEEPITVSKMQPDGYLILNGHHRWAAALRENVDKVRVVIVNPRH